MKAFFAIALATTGIIAYAGERFPVLAPDQLTPEQSKLVQSLLKNQK